MQILAKLASPKMQSVNSPKCPRCGSTELQKLSERFMPNDGGFLSAGDDAPNEKISVYRCKCGDTFTRSFKHAADRPFGRAGCLPGTVASD
jgi:hypothetical protein